MQRLTGGGSEGRIYHIHSALGEDETILTARTGCMLSLEYFADYDHPNTIASAGSCLP